VKIREGSVKQRACRAISPGLCTSQKKLTPQTSRRIVVVSSRLANSLRLPVGGDSRRVCEAARLQDDIFRSLCFPEETHGVDLT